MRKLVMLEQAALPLDVAASVLVKGKQRVTG